MKKSTQVIALLITAIFLVATISYLWMHSSLAEMHSSLADKNDKIDSLQARLTDKDREIESVENKIMNIQKFERLLLRGILDEGDALANRGYGHSSHDYFSTNYEGGYYEVAQGYADAMDVYYEYARKNMDKAKGRFELAKRFAPGEKYLELIDNYIKMSEYAIQIYSEAHQAGEYFSTACGYYAKERWEAGDLKLGKGNEHMEARDNLVDNYNECLANIRALLDAW